MVNKPAKITIDDLVKNNHNGIIVTDKNHIIQYANHSVKKQFDSISVGGHFLHICTDFEPVSEKEDFIYNITLEGRSYTILQIAISSGTFKDRILYLFLDLNQHMMLEKELAEQKELSNELMEIFEGSFDGILVTDAQGKILYVNDSYERVAEIKRTDMQGKSMRDLINPVWMPNSVAYIVAEQKQPISKRQIVKSGRHIMVTGRPVFGKKNEIKKIVINARDITEIYQLTEELQESKQMSKMYLQNYSNLVEQQDNTDKNSMLAVSEAMRNVLALAERVANFNATVLVLGETGVGKEEVAKFIHNKSLREKQPFIDLNCGAIPANLLESELFGYESGAFTGAMNTGKEGLLEAANGGTVFLDEIGETPLDFQVKLLRFLETKEVRRVGSIKAKTLDVRVIAATNRDLNKMVQEGTFREDLYYRINVVQINVPPLRKRKEDIMPLASLFLHRFNKMYDQEKLFTHEVIVEFEKYPWVGNVRQLKNIVENLVVVSNNEYLQTEDLSWIIEERISPSQQMIGTVMDNEDLSLSEAAIALEKLMLERAKETCHTTREIAAKLKINQSTVVRKMQKYGL